MQPAMEHLHAAICEAEVRAATLEDREDGKCRKHPAGYGNRKRTPSWAQRASSLETGVYGRKTVSCSAERQRCSMRGVSYGIAVNLTTLTKKPEFPRTPLLGNPVNRGNPLGIHSSRAT